MPDPDLVQRYAPANDAESHELQRLWSSGRLAEHRVRVLAFVEHRRAALTAIGGASEDPAVVLGVVKTLIASTGTIHLASELRDQSDAMRAEIWIRGELGDHDQRRIATDWVQRRAENWRRWRIKEYLFVVDQCAAEIAVNFGRRVDP